MVSLKFYESSAVIQASPQTIWLVLTNAAQFPEWNTAVEKIDGSIAAGQSITVHAKVSPGRSFPVKVTTFDAPRTMVWSGGMPLGLFKGVRTFTLTPRGDSGTNFKMREEYSGPLLGMIWKSMPDLGPAFEEWAACVKKRAEATA